MKIKNFRKLFSLLLTFLLTLSFLSGCMVDQHPESSTQDGADSAKNQNVETMLDITDPQEKAAVESAKRKVSVNANLRIIATSPAVAEICDKLDLDLVGVCSSSVSKIPKRYKKAKKIGTAMSPDMEIVSSLNPDWILSPSSLQSDLQPKYENIQTDWAFLNLKSVQGMYRSIQELGDIFGKQEQASTLTEDFKTFYQKYKRENEGKQAPKVLILMGMPGSYVIATENSYVGSLVE